MAKYWKDALERILWTALAAALAAGGVYIADLPEVYIPIATVVLTTVKVAVAKKVGDPTSAAIFKE